MEQKLSDESKKGISHEKNSKRGNILELLDAVEVVGVRLTNLTITSG